MDGEHRENQAGQLSVERPVPAALFSYEDIVQRLPMAVALTVLQQQEKEFAIRVGEPSNDWLAKLPSEETRALLTENTEVYDDDMEDLLDTDEVYLGLIAYKRKGHDSDALITAMRARRTAVVRFMLEMIADNLPPVAPEVPDTAA